MTQPIALITGASRGIGAATAQLLAQRGYDLAINYQHNAAAANEVVAAAHSHGVRAVAIQADVSQESDVVHLFKRIDDELGTITALVNNAGIVQPQTRVEWITEDRLDLMYRTNVNSAFLCCREAVTRMATDKGGQGGAIVNVSSAASRLGAPNEYVDYAASKAAVDALTKGLSLEVAAQGIRVNAVRPGLIETEIHASGGEPDRVARMAPAIPMQRGGTAEEVAQSIAWLLSDEASYITGSFIDAAGGR
ncbi:NAD(P)-dependent oxidoreductase [Saccharospirillum sp. MSK14-1]|uniref:SDR family oxidoreductase n=1 Tax=Saccharospirillum sp. MSK14-1 TaxID=1897632 RepID=UPI000D363ED3|nr:SDR family oxidoreductase [Saccharospirillum sp. MSK14-1]PTY36447.1 NAD(P)-dependent oxidoreductase [Saccharospirillum sp. MSK14-1]